MKTPKTTYFTAFFEKNELGGYTVSVPALPGLVTEGKNLENAKKMAVDAIKCYIDGLKKLKQKVSYEGEVASFKIAVAA